MFDDIIKKERKGIINWVDYLGLNFFDVDISTISNIDFYIKVRNKEKKYKCYDRLLTIDDYCDAVFFYFPPDIVNTTVIIEKNRNQVILTLPELENKPNLLINFNEFMQKRRLVTVQLYISSLNQVKIMRNMNYNRLGC